MKKIFILLVSLFLIGSIHKAFPQQGTITVGIIGTECDNIILTWTSTYSFVGTGNNLWAQATFTISWPETSSTDENTLGTITSIQPGFTGWAYDGAATLVGGTNWQRKVILPVGGYTQNIPVGTTEIIMIKLEGSGSGNFTLVNPITNISSLNFSGEMWSGSFNPVTVTGVTFANAVKWNGTRWCGGTSTTYAGEPGPADQGITCTISGANGVIHTVDARVSTLTVNNGADVTVAPGASFTTYGSINVNSPNGLNIDANTTSTGSFISRAATFNYGTGGSSYVKQYFTDNVTEVPFHIHLVGPLVYDPAFLTETGFRGVYLNAFNMADNFTYAYKFDNTLVGEEWVNVSTETDPVFSTEGLALGTTTNTPVYLNMTGKLVHGTINTSNGPSMANYGLNLLSNPYPSGLNLNSFLSTNYEVNMDLGADIWVWEGANTGGSGGNYSNYNYDLDVGTNGLASKILRVGQGFFTEFTEFGSNRTASFALPMRTHATGILLKEDPADLLRIYTRGNNFSDESIIAFRDFGNSGYGLGDSEKWPSMYENATESWTVSADGKNLAINTLAPLGTEVVSVPFSFKCGADGTYSIEAANTSSFDVGSEIFLEDLLTGADWHNLMVNPVYEFNGSASDVPERFILHFFGPTSVDDPDDEMADVKDVRIYGYGHDAYIVNFGSETVKEFVAYDLMGRELHRGTLPNNSVNKVQIGDVSAYYIVKVITKEGNVYTGKVYITK